MRLARRHAAFPWLLASLLTGCAGARPTAVVAVSVVDLRAQPRTHPKAGVHDALQETQALYGEYLRVLKSEDGWAFVESLEQSEFTHNKKWQGYPGWVPSEALAPWQQVWEPTIIITRKWARPWLDAYKTRPAPVLLPMGAQIHGIDLSGAMWRVELVNGSTAYLLHAEARSLEELTALAAQEKRRLILAAAEQFIGDPYLWGGRSPHASAEIGSVTGVDCSGLVNLAYRTVGIAVPRDAHEQSLRAKPVKTLQPGDLIFLSERGNPARIVHVMLFAGNGDVIEAPGTGEAVRRIALAKRLGKSIDQLTSGSVIDEQTVSFGTYFP